MGKRYFLVVGLSVAISAITNFVPAHARAAETMESYRVRIPATTQTCEVEAERLAMRFSKATGFGSAKSECVSVLDYKVDEKTYALYSLALSIPSRIMDRLSSSVYGYLDSYYPNDLGDYYGLYSTYEACIGALGDRSQEFEKHTGLMAVAAFCTRARVNASYVLQIDGFGKPKKKLGTFDPTFKSAMDAATKADFIQLLNKMGAFVVADLSSRAFYYSKESLEFSRSKMLSYQPAALCSSQLAAAKDILSRLTKLQPVLACIKSAHTKDERYDLFAAWSGEQIFSQQVSFRYLSFQECLSDQKRVLDLEARDYGQRPLGAICSLKPLAGQPEEFMMEIYKGL